MASASTIAGKCVLAAAIVSGIAYMSLPITRLVGVEMIESLRPAFRQGSMVSVARIKAVVDVTIKAARTVEPRASSDKHSANPPVGPIVAVGCAVVGRVIEISVGANGRHSDVDADSDLG